MRKLLVLAFLLYDIIAIATRLNNYDYDDIDGSKRHLEERRNWRKKVLSKSADEHRDWERKRFEYENPRYAEDMDSKSYNTISVDRQRETDAYRHRRFDDVEKIPPGPPGKSAETGHSSFSDKEDKKFALDLNCQRPNEKYESCFAGCASVTCDNPRDRMQPCYPFCEAGCVCVHPYVRDDRTHKCVLPEDCTKGLKGIPDLGEENPTQ